ncbi:MAG: MerR family transcriptional regulator [Proteobacteria bacterium]|nr:MerR family transcriptional regulator [Pseudomonadota bacterium]
MSRFLNSSDAAKRLGVSIKALRLYEQRGLVAPGRTAAGWRAYGPDDLARASEVVALRALGLSLAEVARVLDGDAARLEAALAAHQAALQGQVGDLAATIEKVRRVRMTLAHGNAPAQGELARLLKTEGAPGIAFDLPWPWGGERFELRDIRPLTHIVGPLGSGKTRLAMRLAESLPGALFLGLDRVAPPVRDARIEPALAWLVGEGAHESDALVALLTGIETHPSGSVVIDMLEQGLDQPTQEAVIAYLRLRGPDRPPLFFLTRSTAILDLGSVGPGEAILFCPANHSVPMQVSPYPGAEGYEAVASCLASPDVRSRTEGVVAWRPAGKP